MRGMAWILPVLHLCCLDKKAGNTGERSLATAMHPEGW